MNAHRMNGVISGSISRGLTYHTFVFIVKFKCYNNRSTKGAVDVLPLHSWGLLVSGPSYSYSPCSNSKFKVTCKMWTLIAGTSGLIPRRNRLKFLTLPLPFCLFIIKNTQPEWPSWVLGNLLILIIPPDVLQYCSFKHKKNAKSRVG